jgi:hypothetical protein
MNEKWKDLNKYYKTDKYSSYDKLLKGFGSYGISDILDEYTNNDWITYKPKKEETPQEREARLLREKAQAREAKINQILEK